MALREFVGKKKIDDLMQNRSTIGPKLLEMKGNSADKTGTQEE